MSRMKRNQTGKFQPVCWSQICCQHSAAKLQPSYTFHHSSDRLILEPLRLPSFPDISVIFNLRDGRQPLVSWWLKCITSASLEETAEMWHFQMWLQCSYTDGWFLKEEMSFCRGLAGKPDGGEADRCVFAGFIVTADKLAVVVFWSDFVRLNTSMMTEMNENGLWQQLPKMHQAAARFPVCLKKPKAANCSF